MAYFFELAQTSGTALITSVAMNMPEHATNDILVAMITVDSGTITVAGSAFVALPGAPANPVTSGIISYLLYFKATSSASTLTLTTADAYTCGVYCYKEVDGTTPFDGVTPIHSAIASSSTPVGQAITTTTANALVVSMIGSEGTTPQCLSDPGYMWIDNFDSTGTTATTSAHQSAAWYINRAAGVSPVPAYSTNAAGTYVRVMFALKPAAGSKVPAYIDDVSAPATRLTCGHHIGTLNNISFPAALTATAAINGKTATFSAATVGADLGINPYANALAKTSATVAATVLAGYEIIFTGNRNLSTGLIMGSLISGTPKMGTFGLGTDTHGGFVVRLGSSSTAWNSYQVAARNSVPTTEQRSVFAIQAGYTGSTYGATQGTAVTTTAVSFMQFLLNCPSFATLIYLSELHQVFKQVIAGGDSTFPVDTVGMVEIGKSFRLPVIQKAGASGLVSFAPIQIGGGDAVNFQIDSGSLQFPVRYNTTTNEFGYHAADNSVGISYAGKSGDVIKHTNSLISSPTPFYWEINSAATNAATWDFSGTSVIGAAVTLRNVMTFDSLTFTSCPSLDFSSCAIQNSKISKVPVGNNTLTTNGTTAISNCAINVSAVTAGNYWTSVASPSIFTGNAFTGGGGHAIRITTPGTYTLTGNTFTGFGADTTTGAAIFNDSAGSVTINVSGGSTPTYRNGTSATTVVNNNVTITLTGLKNPSEVRVFNAGTQTEVSGTGAENVITGSHAFSIGASVSVDISIISLGYQNMRILAYSSASSASLPVSQVIDRQYLNP